MIPSRVARAAPQSCCIVGGGIAGVALSRELARHGVGVTLLERTGQLCSGATWHAAGLVTRFAGSPKLKKLHVRSLAMLNEMHDRADIGLHRDQGSIRLIEKGDRDRYLEAQQQVGMSALYDDPKYPTRMISRAEIEEMHPLLCTENIDCGVHTPWDGDIDPTLLTNAVAKDAKGFGAVMKMNMEVKAVTARPTGGFDVTIVGPDGESVQQFDTVVNAAGLWSRQFSEDIMGLSFADHPCFVIEHQYVVSETLPEIAARQKAGLPRLPVIRDLAGSQYIRQERTGILIGPYEQDCRLSPYPKAPPRDFENELFPGDLERLEDNIMHAIELIPGLGEVGFINTTNGPTIWTGDSLARCGRTKIPGYYDFNTLTYGITHGLPLAEYLSHVMIHGEQPKGYDLFNEADPLRYNGWCTPESVEGLVRQTYTHNNQPYFPYENRKGGREELPRHSLYEAMAKRGAWFGFANAGVEVPLFFLPSNASAESINEKKFSHQDWEDIVAAEARAVLKGVGVSQASFSKMRVSGPGAFEHLDKMTTAVLPKKVGATKLTYSLTPSGRIQAEFTICKLADDDFYLVGGRSYLHHDLELLARGAPTSVKVENLSDDVEIIHVAGPDSKEVVGAIHPDMAEVGFLTMNPIEVEGLGTVKTFRVSFTGCLGYELHVPSGQAAALYEKVLDAGAGRGIVNFGNYALDSLRVEKGFKLKGDFDYCHYLEAGISPFVSKKKEFTGRDPSYKAERQACFYAIQVEKGWGWSVPSDCPIRREQDDEIVGYTTSCAPGASLSGTTVVANGFVIDSSDLGKLYVMAYGQRWPCTFLSQPPLKAVGRDEAAGLDAAIKACAQDLASLVPQGGTVTTAAKPLSVAAEAS
mmetsp:Transcript_34570/g.75711  ORF Transcript_34570/g.75711 Transcript_34570/m.75711 type:complete len:866 (-) Transcript_34570:195-2792(-)